MVHSVQKNFELKGFGYFVTFTSPPQVWCACGREKGYSILPNTRPILFYKRGVIAENPSCAITAYLDLFIKNVLAGQEFWLTFFGF